MEALESVLLMEALESDDEDSTSLRRASDNLSLSSNSTIFMKNGGVSLQLQVELCEMLGNK